MSTKTENVKTFLNQVGKENQLFLFVGYSEVQADSNSTKAEVDAWKNSDFSIKVGKDSVIGVAPKIKWVRGRSYVPWNSYTQNTGNYYVYNDINGYVYLCLSDDIDNRADLSGNKGSANIPSHVAGDYTYDDGYTWKALYKITPGLEKFVSEIWIPVISFDMFEGLDKTSPFSQIQTFCSPYNTSDSGKCAIYFKENTKYYGQSGQLISAAKGSLNTIFTTLTCTECYNIFKDHPTYVSRFNSNESDSEIEIQDAYDAIADLVNANKISTSSPYFYLYQANKTSPNEGYIVSASIDLSSFDLVDRKISSENPELTITSNTGTDASIILRTYLGNDNNHYVSGIQIVSGGQGYKDVSLSLTSANLLGTMTANDIISNIQINLDEIDGLGFDPMKVLNVQHTMIDVKVDKQTLFNSDISIPTAINFYSLIQNPKYGNNSNFEYIAGTTESKYQSTLYRTTTKVLIALDGKQPPSKNGTTTITKPTGTIVTGIEIATSTDIIDTAYFNPVMEAEVELKHLEYSESTQLTGGSLSVDGVDYTITSVSAPNLVQYTGKVLSANKTTTIDIQDVDTAIIRINMVKGM